MKQGISSQPDNQVKHPNVICLFLAQRGGDGNLLDTTFPALRDNKHIQRRIESKRCLRALHTSSPLSSLASPVKHAVGSRVSGRALEHVVVRHASQRERRAGVHGRRRHGVAGGQHVLATPVLKLPGLVDLCVLVAGRVRGQAGGARYRVHLESWGCGWAWHRAVYALVFIVCAIQVEFEGACCH